MTVSDLFGFVKALAQYDYTPFIIVWKTIAVTLSLVLIASIVYTVWKLNIVAQAWRESVFGKPEQTVSAYRPPGLTYAQKARENWERIMERGTSEDENERKLSIIAADSLVDNILKLTGYDGENLGERLKQIERGDLGALNVLWEAHKIRNRIAHEADYKLSKEAALSALTDYAKALRELNYI